MDLPPGLHAFLVALQAEKVPIEPRQIDWLRRAFALQPQLDRYRLQSLLASVLIKNETQRAVFDMLFDEWCPDRNFELEAETVPDEAPKHTLPQKPPTRSILRRRTATRPGGQTRPAEAVAEAARKRLTAVRLPLPGKWYWWLLAAGAAAVGFGFFFDISQWLRLPGLSEGMLIALSGGSWLSALLLWRFYKQRELPAPLGTARSGPDWLPLPEAAGRDLELLESEAVRSVVWGVGRFVSEELTRQVDLEKTVGATARAGGVPRIHYQPAVYPREVWLWQDVVTQDPTLPRLVEELEISLKQAGLPVRRGFFAGVPEQVRWREGETFSPLVLEGHRQSALVAVMTDGEGIKMASESARERDSLHFLLCALAEWPRLVVVTFGANGQILAKLMGDCGLSCIAPQALPAFLGGGELRPLRMRRTDQRIVGDLRVWAAATALTPQPLAESTAYALRQALELRVSPWRFRDLAQLAETGAGRLGWSPPQRTQWLNWLVQSEPEVPGKLKEGGPLDKALQFWSVRYENEYARRAKQDKDSVLLPWKDTLAERRFRMEKALLELWRNPQNAARELYRLYNPKGRGVEAELKQEIEARLAGLAPREYWAKDRAAEIVFLPWCWQDQRDRVRWMLRRMKFAEAVLPPAGPLRTSGAAAWLMGMCLGVAGAAAVGAGGIVGLGLGALLVGTVISFTRWMRGERVAGLKFEPRVVGDIPGLLEMVELPGGIFQMGSSRWDFRADSNEKPRHSVEVSDFLMGRFPVTRGLYREVLGESLAEWKGAENDDQLPANYVNWFDAIRFCNALSERQGLPACYRIAGEQVEWDLEAPGYRLPTEAEWEYAVRAGTATRWFFGDNAQLLERYAWYGDNAENLVHPVGKKEPNPWELHDMLGNVCEWCWDWYGSYSFGFVENGFVENPTGPDKGDFRVLRGGSSWGDPWNLRSAVRNGLGPEDRDAGVGFRLVRGPRRQL